MLWNQTYEGQQTDSLMSPTAIANSIVQTSDGGYAFAAGAGFGGLPDGILVKTLTPLGIYSGTLLMAQAQ